MPIVFRPRDMDALVIQLAKAIYNEEDSCTLSSVIERVLIGTDADYVVDQSGSTMTTQSGSRLILQ